MKDGANTFRFGTGTPSALHQYTTQLGASKLLLDSLRIQLGDNDSFLAWSRSGWAASGIPLPLLDRLGSLSSAVRDWDKVFKGSFKAGCWPLTNAQWSRHGSYYLQCNGRHMGNWKGRVISDAWNKLWQDKKTEDLRPRIQRELAVSHLTLLSYRRLNMTSMLLLTLMLQLATHSSFSRSTTVTRNQSMSSASVESLCIPT